MQAGAKSMNIAIVGLGRVGGEFLKEILKRGKSDLVVRCVAELSDTPGKEAAIAAGIEVLKLDEVVALGDEVDIIFDTSGNATVREQLRGFLWKSTNEHTVIAPETIARLIWSLLSDETLPEVHGNLGY
jgi:predicted dinucleotide-utilizing enzyme